MQTKEGEKSILEVTRNNYLVPKGEEETYHYKVEKQQFDPETGMRLSNPIIQKTGVKLFPTIKRNLELQGYTIEILYAPDGQYVVTTTREDEEPFKRNLVEKVRDEMDTLRESKDREIEELKAIIAKQSASIAEIKASLAKETPVEGVEEVAEEASAEEAKEAPVAEVKKEVKKAGRPAKK